VNETKETPLEDVTMVAQGDALAGGSPAYNLDMDYTYGGKSGMFGGHGEIAVDKDRKSVTIDTCVPVKQGEQLEIVICNTLRNPKRMADKNAFRIAHKHVDGVFKLQVPKFKKDETAASAVSEWKEDGKQLECTFLRWNSERATVRLTRATYGPLLPTVEEEGGVDASKTAAAAHHDSSPSTSTCAARAPRADTAATKDQKDDQDEETARKRDDGERKREIRRPKRKADSEENCTRADDAPRKRRKRSGSSYIDDDVEPSGDESD
jgi:hypothetical protein